MVLGGSSIKPQVTWGASPEIVLPIDGTLPDLFYASNADQYDYYQRVLGYMGLQAGMKMADIVVDSVFTGSCTNSRIEDPREAAEVVKGKKVTGSVKRALVVPGLELVKEQAERGGLDEICLTSGARVARVWMLYVSGNECGSLNQGGTAPQHSIEILKDARGLGAEPI